MRPALVPEQQDALEAMEAVAEKAQPAVLVVVKCRLCSDTVGRVIEYAERRGAIFQGTELDPDAPDITSRSGRDWMKRYYYALLEHPTTPALPRTLPTFCRRHDLPGVDLVNLLNRTRKARAGVQGTVRI